MNVLKSAAYLNNTVNNKDFLVENFGLSFHFNGQETDDEIAGKGHINTAEYWEYDTRLGRRWNIDPKKTFWESPYACLHNSPIMSIDPDGAEVINGDQMQADNTKLILDTKTQELNNMKTSLNISDGMKKKDFRKAGGTKEQWNAYKDLNDKVNGLNTQYKNELARAAKTQDIINKWSIESPKTYNEVHSKNSKFVLFSLSDYYDPQNGLYQFGYNDPMSNGTNGYYSGKFGIDNAIDVYIDDKVKLTLPDITTNDGPEYTLNHEAGHWLYMIEHPEHIQYMIKHQHDNHYNGGHNTNDPSGRNAAKYGLKKD